MDLLDREIRNFEPKKKWRNLLREIVLKEAENDEEKAIRLLHKDYRNLHNQRP